MAALCRSDNPQCQTEVFPLDITSDFAVLEKAAATIDGGNNGVDVLVLNAGSSQHALAEETQPQVTSYIYIK